MIRRNVFVGTKKEMEKYNNFLSAFKCLTIFLWGSVFLLYSVFFFLYEYTEKFSWWLEDKGMVIFDYLYKRLIK